MKISWLVLAAIIGASLSISPAAWAAVEAARSVDVVLLNQTGRGMTLQGSNLSHGCWHKTPPARIEPNQYITWAAESCGILTGTEGWARYRLDGVSGTAYFYWDNPFIGSNSFHDSAPAGFETGHVGGMANRTTIFFFVRSFSDGPMACNAQWVVDQLSLAPQSSLSTFDRLLGFITNPFKEQGISGWVETGCTATAMAVPVRDGQHSTDGFWTIDARLISFNVGAFAAPPDRFIRIEVRPGTQAHAMVDAHHVTPVDILLLNAPVLIDTDGPFLELHPNQGFQIWDNASLFVGQTNVPATMTTGQVVPVSVTMQNSGTSTWSAANNYWLGSQSPQGNTNWGPSRVPLGANDSIAPGQSKTFTFNITAPSTPGTFSFQWRMLQENVQWFGNASPVTNITVTALPTVTSISGQGDRSLGSTITNTVTVTGGVAPYSYRFLFFYGGYWHGGQPYSASNSWTWTPTSAGNYTTQVWVKSAGSTAAWDAYSQYSFNVTEPYEGYLDQADCNVLAGWAWDRYLPNAPITVDIYANGALQASGVPASSYRADLAAAGKGNGYHAFVWTVPQNLKTGATYSMVANYGGTTAALAATPRSITCSVSLPSSVSVAWIRPAEVTWGPPGTLTVAGYALNGTGGVQMWWRDVSLNSPWNLVGWAPLPDQYGLWSNTIPNSNNCHNYQVWVVYSGAYTSSGYDGPSSGYCAAQAR